MYELWSGIPMGLGTPIENIWASLSVKSAEVGEPKKCEKPSGCHEFICLLSLFVAYCILVFACNEVFVFAADQRERFVCWRLIPAPFSFPHHHIVIRPATTAHICWILTRILQYKYWYCYVAIECRPWNPLSLSHRMVKALCQWSWPKITKLGGPGKTWALLSQEAHVSASFGKK